jgi:MFS family permease
MPNAYSEILNIPGAKAFVGAALVGRMAMSMTGIAIVTMLSQLRDSYAAAGSVAAAFSLAFAVLGPQISGLVDRHGQAKILPFAAGLSTLAMLCLAYAAHTDASLWVLLLFAAVAGCMPGMSAMSRARWTQLCRTGGQLKTAYALESVLDEMSFVIGPPLSVAVSVALFPEAGLVAALVLQLIGVGIFVLQRRTEPQVSARLATPTPSPIRVPDMWSLLTLMLAMGTIVGAIDVLSVALALRDGVPYAAGIILSIYAIGSCLSGVLFGAYKWHMPLARQLLYFGIALGASTASLLLVDDIPRLAICIFIGGISFAPTMIIAMSFVEKIIPSEKLTEGFSWLISGIGLGMAWGAFSAGQVSDLYGVKAGFLVTVAAGILAVLAVAFGYRRLRLY